MLKVSGLFCLLCHVGDPSLTLIHGLQNVRFKGYLWDEGFHQQLVRLWDLDWTLKILKSWFGKTDELGWIPRQMIIGAEVRWSARPSSWPQIPCSANPPSHHWVLDSILKQESDNGGGLLDDFLREIWMPLERNFKWYLRTQTSLIPGLLRWAGRTREYCLPSGMDDYPRAPIMTKREAHLDLHSWMIVSSRAISKTASRLGKSEEYIYYEELSKNLTKLLLDNFWDEDRNLMDDFYFSKTGEKKFVGHFGYLNFFPLFLHALPTDSNEFAGAMSRLLDRGNGMWTKFGLRSLSSHDPYYLKGDSYWTGLIWFNINYLAISSFFNYANNPIDYPMSNSLRGMIRLAYHELRQGLIRLVVENFVDTGFIWEVYDGSTGKGQDNHPFTGWTALIVNVLAEIY
mmetsp:Transcript_5436/g.10217  ORF Transcript_5436/g.10217 Transcript_5436/m.10217 type:complete len:400 (-) Transcript_5436:222-1421(-)